MDGADLQFIHGPQWLLSTTGDERHESAVVREAVVAIRLSAAREKARDVKRTAVESGLG